MRSVLPAHSGSSPPARGTLQDHHRVTGVRRFIPARAGNTPSPSRPFVYVSVHPRPRGEHLQGLRRDRVSNGSSPPARGTLDHLAAHAQHRRFIPARAGNTWRAREASVSASVHPRPRGEHTETSEGPDFGAGSSPPARGTQPRPCRWRGSSRFIPARAGNTVTRSLTSASRSVHPRPRGEHAAR